MNGKVRLGGRFFDRAARMYLHLPLHISGDVSSFETASQASSG